MGFEHGNVPEVGRGRFGCIKVKDRDWVRSYEYLKIEVRKSCSFPLKKFRNCLPMGLVMAVWANLNFGILIGLKIFYFVIIKNIFKSFLSIMQLMLIGLSQF